jgi:hypothetical protein
MMPSVQVEEARRLRNLGRNVEAGRIFEEIRLQDDSLLIATECAGLYLEQGRIMDACRTIDGALSNSRHLQEDKSSVGVAKMLQALITSARTATFTQPLQDAVNVYNDHLLGRNPCDYEKESVSHCNFLSSINTSMLTHISGHDAVYLCVPPRASILGGIQIARRTSATLA